MNTSKHTPGPWTIEDGIRGTTAIIGSDTDGGTAVLARLPHWPIEKEMQASNARLIAAAPELAAALRGIIETLGYLEANGGIDAPHRLALIAGRDAIAKAEGGAA
jgi:hypothetical protein